MHLDKNVSYGKAMASKLTVDEVNEMKYQI